MRKWLAKYWGHIAAGAAALSLLFVAWVKTRGLIRGAVDAEVGLAEKHSANTAEDVEHTAKETRHHAADAIELKAARVNAESAAASAGGDDDDIFNTMRAEADERG